MSLTIEEINTSNLSDVNRCDNEFIIDSRLVLYLDHNEIRYSLTPMPAPTRKRYDIDVVDYSTYIDNLEKVVYLAYQDGQVVGQIILRKNWNMYGYIEDITVDAQFRRRGIGKELLVWAKQWARSRKLAGIMLETQDNNVAACKFYESCGFQLKGFDSYLYKGISPKTDEVALYWYLVFDKESPEEANLPDTE